TINQRHDKEDANFDITSNADVNEKKIIRLTAYIPLPFVSGVAGMFLGKTKSQWDAGALSSTFDAVSLGVAKFHPTLSFITDYGLPVTQIASMGQSDPGPANPANPGDPNDPDDPNNPDNTQIHWQNYGVNNWNKSW
ncbi:MAG TPA: hypothetical protein VL997_05220, partial [Dyella sp.]|nr:hypothetical protein [Dyella sp.]